MDEGFRGNEDLTPPHQAAADGDLGINTPTIWTLTFSLLVNIICGDDDLTLATLTPTIGHWTPATIRRSPKVPGGRGHVGSLAAGRPTPRRGATGECRRRALAPVGAEAGEQLLRVASAKRAPLRYWSTGQFAQLTHVTRRPISPLAGASCATAGDLETSRFAEQS